MLKITQIKWKRERRHFLASLLSSSKKLPPNPTTKPETSANKILYFRYYCFASWNNILSVLWLMLNYSKIQLRLKGEFFPWQTETFLTKMKWNCSTLIFFLILLCNPLLKIIINFVFYLSENHNILEILEPWTHLIC